MTTTRREYPINGHVLKVSIRPCSKSDPTLIMDYYLPDGKRQRPRLGTSNLDDALMASDLMVSRADFHAKFPMRGHSFNGHRDADPTLDRVVEYYLDTALVAAQRTVGTRNQYRFKLGEFTDFCAEQGVSRVSNLNREVTDRYAAMLTKGGNSPKSVKDKLGVVRACINAAVDADIIEVSPIRKWLKVFVPEPEIEFLSPKEMKRLLKAIKRFAPEDYGICSWMAGSGNRPSDSKALILRQVDLDNRIVRRTQVKSKRLAKYEIGDLCVSAVRGEMAKRDIGPDDLVFLNKFGRPYSNTTLQNILIDVVALAKFPRHVSPKIFRHTYGTTMANSLAAPMSLEKLRIQMGHADIETTLRYVHNVEGGKSIGEYEGLIT